MDSLRVILTSLCAAFMLCAASLFAIDIPGPVDSGMFGYSVNVLPNGNIVVTDPGYSPGGIANVGAVYLYSGATLQLISTLTGSQANDSVGSNGVYVLANGNYVVLSTFWNNGSNAMAGAVTWCSHTTGLSGMVSASNSIVGADANDVVGSDGIYPLPNGNFVVVSSVWTNGTAQGAGAVTWADGQGATVGAVTSANSLIGNSFNDAVGLGVLTPGVTVLTNGNYVVASPNWKNPVGPLSKAGAVTWCSGAGPTAGVLTTANSLVGDAANDNVGSGGVYALTNGNYVIGSPAWKDTARSITKAGAATWGNGATGVKGTISTGNSLIGNLANDGVGLSVTALTNGNYVVRSPNVDNPIGPVTNVGAVTWCNGTTGMTGLVTSANSLMGVTANDKVGGSGVTALTNGNYVVSSYTWSDPSALVQNAGAVTWCDGSAATVGTVTAANSLIGVVTNDLIGYDGATALSNGNYVVISELWNNPSGAAQVGAVTWCSGTGTTSAKVTALNSLVGGSAKDGIGEGGITALNNANYVVNSFNWNNPTSGIAKVGAVTWGNGVGGTVGLVSPSNSLVGSTANDTVGVNYIRALSNGNYVVGSAPWDNPNSGAPITDAGAITLCKGVGGTVGAVTPANSLVGGTASDQLGFGEIEATPDGQYAVQNSYWSNPTGTVMNAAEATLASGTTGATGLVQASNSVLGTVTSDVFGLAYDSARSRLVVGRPGTNQFTILNSAVAATHFSVVASGTAPYVTGSSVTLTVTALDGSNAPVLGYTGSVHFSSSDAIAQLPADYTFLSSDNGTHTFSVTLNTPGAQTVTVANTITPSIAGSATLSVVAAATHFSVQAPPTSSTGASFALVVTALDANNATVTSYLGTIHFTSTDASANLPADYTFVAADNGSHTFSATLNKKGAQTVSVSDAVAAISGTSDSVLVKAPATHFSVSAPVASTTGVLTSVTVTALDASNAAVTAYTGRVHLTSTDGSATLSADYTFAATENGTHSFSVVFNTPGAQTVTSTDTVSPSVTGTSNAINVAPAIVFSSNPSAVPNPANAGQAVTFTAAASGGTGDLTYAWNFGDGTAPATGASVTHIYATAGTFTATVTAIDSLDEAQSGAVVVTVNFVPVIGTGPDTDGDGFSDGFENSVGTDPLLASSSPTGTTISAADIKPLTLTRPSIKLNFAKPSVNDSIMFTGTVPVPLGFTASCVKVYVVVGGIIKTLTLNTKASALSGGDSFKLTLKAKKGVVQAAPAAKFTAAFKKGTFASTLASSGLTNSTMKAASVNVAFTLIFNGAVYQKIQTMSYTAKLGKSGAAK